MKEWINLHKKKRDKNGEALLPGVGIQGLSPQSTRHHI